MIFFFSVHLLGTCPFFLRVYHIMWVFKVAGLMQSIKFPSFPSILFPQYSVTKR